MLTINPQMLEGLIRDYIIHLRRERNLSPATVSTYLAAITHFYEMNDATIKWKKLKKFKAKHYNVVEDKPYTREQIKTLVDAAPLRDKCIILLMSSAGLRRGDSAVEIVLILLTYRLQAIILSHHHFLLVIHKIRLLHWVQPLSL